MWLQTALLLLASQAHGVEKCDYGIYGENCDRTCPSNCYPDLRRNLRHCQKYTGKCSEGCVRGYHGDQCNISCSRGCLNETCNIGDGYCTLGCKQTYIGDFCNATLASPPEPVTDVVPIIVPIIVIILILVIVAVVVCMVRKRRQRRNANFDGSSPEDNPLMARSGTGAARAVRGVDQQTRESGAVRGVDQQTRESVPLGLRINNTRSLFVETVSFKKVKEMLEKFHHVTISGAPGEGKTSTALMLGAEYRKQGYELVLVEDVDTFQLYDCLSKGKDVCVIFDDIFQNVGPSMDVQRLKQVLDELHLHLTQCKNRPERRNESNQKESGEDGRRDNQSNMYLIFTSESTILERAMSKLKRKTYSFFNKSTTADLTKSCCYTNAEKEEIWLKYKRHYKYKAKVYVIDFCAYDKNTIGFPLVCKLLSSYVAFQERHEDFLKNPVSSLNLELREVISQRDDQSAALILVLLCDGQLNIGQLEAESDPGLETHLQAVLTLVPTSTNQSVAKAVRSLCGSLLTDGNITTFSHSVIYDVCVSVLHSIEPEFVRRHFSI